MPQFHRNPSVSSEFMENFVAGNAIFAARHSRCFCTAAETSCFQHFGPHSPLAIAVARGCLRRRGPARRGRPHPHPQLKRASAHGRSSVATDVTRASSSPTLRRSPHRQLPTPSSSPATQYRLLAVHVRPPSQISIVNHSQQDCKKSVSFSSNLPLFFPQSEI